VNLISKQPELLEGRWKHVGKTRKHPSTALVIGLFKKMSSVAAVTTVVRVLHKIAVYYRSIAGGILAQLMWGMYSEINQKKSHYQVTLEFNRAHAVNLISKQPEMLEERWKHVGKTRNHPSAALRIVPLLKISSVATATAVIVRVLHKIAVSHRTIARTFLVLLLQGMFSKANQKLFHLIVMMTLPVNGAHAVNLISKQPERLEERLKHVGQTRKHTSTALRIVPLLKIGSVAAVTTVVHVLHKTAVSHRPIARTFLVLLLQGSFSKANQNRLNFQVTLPVKRIHAVYSISKQPERLEERLKHVGQTRKHPSSAIPTAPFIRGSEGSVAAVTTVVRVLN
jgi:hypothetical protein